MTRELALCADDFGHSAVVDHAILGLAAGGRLTEVSCMVSGPAWPADAAALAALPAVEQGQVRIGLHFNLTQGAPVSPALARHWPQLPALPRLIALAHLRQLPLAALAEELQAQFSAFEAATGRTPTHLDGHQHVHHLPGVREIVLRALSSRPGLRVRHTGRVGGPGFGIKRWLIAATGGAALGRRLEQLGRQANSALLGVYDFVAPDYRSLMQGWLAALPAQGGLILCHPGESGVMTQDQPGDPIAAARARELAYLGSEAFATDLLAADVRLVRSG